MTASTAHKLFVLHPGKGEIFTCDEDGQNKKVVQSGLTMIPDGIVIDPVKKHIYFTQMGKPNMKEGSAYDFDGSVWRMNLDGSDLTTIVQPGYTRTPKQITADFAAGKLYWSDREGMRVMRCSLDGSELETLVQTGVMPNDERDQTHWCVGIAVDPDAGHVYWTTKGGDNAGLGVIYRAGIDVPAGESPTSRNDIEVLFDKLPEPIDLDLDKDHGYLYWTDRGDLPGGNSVCRAKFNADGSLTREHDVIVEGTGETIAAAFDHESGYMFITCVEGKLFRAKIEGGKPEVIAQHKMLTGITLL